MKRFNVEVFLEDHKRYIYKSVTSKLERTFRQILWSSRNITILIRRVEVPFSYEQEMLEKRKVKIFKMRMFLAYWKIKPNIFLKNKNCF